MQQVDNTVYRVPEGCKLDLTGYRGDPADQRYLMIHDPTWIPPIGAYVMGCNESVTIYPDPTSAQGGREYFRPGYTTLYENFARVDLDAMTAWYIFGRRRGTPHPGAGRPQASRAVDR